MVRRRGAEAPFGLRLDFVERREPLSAKCPSVEPAVGVIPADRDGVERLGLGEARFARAVVIADAIAVDDDLALDLPEAQADRGFGRVTRVRIRARLHDDVAFP